jgi:fatty-acyl-CoA synthase
VILFGSERPGFVDDKALGRRVTETGMDEIEALRARVRVGDTAMLLYTSGTSADPKGCFHTHEAIVRNAIETSRTRFCLTSADRFWDPLPMFHVGALLPLLATFEAGATFLSMAHIEAKAALEQIVGERASWLFPAFPAIANLLLDEPTFGTRDLSAVRMTMCVGTPATLRALQQALPNAVQISCYGSTETGGVIVYHLPTDTADQRATTCGTPLRGVELSIGNVDLGPVGEILVRGYPLLKCYYKDPEQSAQVIDEDGWFHTGDLGSIDENGQLSFRGRLKETLKVGGENVAPLEVETLLAEHPSVLLAQVVGFPDERLDEVVAAFVELKDGCYLTADELIEFCATRIATFKVPRVVRFISDWPMSATKVNKRRLSEMLLEAPMKVRGRS